MYVGNCTVRTVLRLSYLRPSTGPLTLLVIGPLADALQPYNIQGARSAASAALAPRNITAVMQVLSFYGFARRPARPKQCSQVTFARPTFASEDVRVAHDSRRHRIL